MMSLSRALARAAAMDAREVRFRAASAARRAADRARAAVYPPAWDLSALANILDPGISPLVARACEAVRRGAAMDAHRALAEHVSTRASRWPVRAANRARLVRSIVDRFPDAAARAREAADPIVDGRLDFLAYAGIAAGNPPDWHLDPIHGRRAPARFWADVPYLDPSCGDHKVIWEINRHQYFLDLGTAYWLTGDDTYRDTFVAHLTDWIDENPPLRGVNWASMLELAFRALSWTWAVEFFADARDDGGGPQGARARAAWLPRLLVALDRQLVHVSENLSRYFSPNTHLSGEALGLYAVSVAFPELRRSRRLAALGREILLQEAERQILRDGGHVELSPHYHRYSTDFYLLALMIARAAGDPASERFEQAARAQTAYLRTIADDAGHLPLIGDDDGGQLFRFGPARPWDASSSLDAAASLLSEPSFATGPAGPSVCWILGEAPAIETAAPPVWRSRMLADSGYFVSRSPQGGHLVFQAGRHGFLNGGHAHSDALSVVLSIGGTPLLIDPGTATYTMDRALRDRLRSTRMHNTAIVGGHDPAEPSGPFHWRTRADATLLASAVTDEYDFAAGALLANAGTAHVRAVLSLHGVGWLIVDGAAQGDAETAAEIWWHVHPAWSVARSFGTGGGTEARTVTFRHGDGSSGALVTTSKELHITRDPEAAICSSVYGATELGTAILASERGRSPLFVGTFLPALRAAGAGRSGVCIRRVDSAGATTAGWVMPTFEIAIGAVERRIGIPFPADLRAQPRSGWPQPCIGAPRAHAKEMALCAE